MYYIGESNTGVPPGLGVPSIFLNLAVLGMYNSPRKVFESEMWLYVSGIAEKFIENEGKYEKELQWKTSWMTKNSGK